MPERLVRRSVRCALVAGALLVPIPVLAAAGTQPGTLAIPTVASPPPLDPKDDGAAWKDAALVPLPWDVQHQRPSSEPSSARIATDGANIYVRFEVAQR
ncbi:MAG TPA: hypothetical protein VHT53_00720, partial [Candidatus Elarobacter sp.]|nr:hypothetical protein [Candidatus Elarobacter sp.]